MNAGSAGIIHRPRSAGSAGRGFVAAYGVFGLALALFLCAPAAAGAACPNGEFRVGRSADLPDCRAYELVTRSQSEGRRVTLLEPGLIRNYFATELASPSGESFAFFLQGASLPEQPGGTGTYERYESRRFADGWHIVRRLMPTGVEAVFPNGGGISSDHQYYFVNVGGDEPGSLVEDGKEANFLGNPDGTLEPVGQGTFGTEPTAEGWWITPGGTHVVFSTGGPVCGGSSECEIKQLEPNAPPTGTPAVYERGADGPTRVVSLLPGEITPAEGEGAEYQGVSEDGSTIAFALGEKLYVRVDGEKTEEAAPVGFTFAGISRDGGEVFYMLAGDAFVFDVGSEETRQITSTGDVELVNVSADGSHVYFISPSEIGGAGTEGEPNLYGWSSEGETTLFIGTVSPADLGGTPALNNWTTRVVVPRLKGEDGPGAESAQTTPDGSVLVFQSRAQLTEYANEGFAEIYRFDFEDPSLVCVSCDPSGAPPAADSRLEATGVEEISTRLIVHNVSSDGSLVFFETAAPLAARDNDLINDIYEWKSVPGAIAPQLDLLTLGATPSYSPGSTETNIIAGITPDGGNVFFKSIDALVPSAAEGVPAFYDARVNGGFPEPLGAACAGESCQPLPAPPPTLDQPVSSAFLGRGNLNQRHRRCHRVRRGKPHRGKRRCVRRHHHRSARVLGTANTTEGGAR